jgi:hypothetical protein
LIEKRLKDVMIASIYENDLCIASFQGPRRRDPGKAAANDHDALAFRWRGFRTRQLFPWAGLFQGCSHWGHLVHDAMRVAEVGKPTSP